MTVRRLSRLSSAAGAAALVALSLTTGPVAAAADEIVVQGEDAVATNFAPGVTADARMSGGEFLKLWSRSAPSGAYTAEYQVTAPEDGLYQLDVATTPASGVSWAAPHQIKVNDGAFETPVAVQYGQVTAEVKLFHLGTVLLDAGTNSITFQVTEPRGTGEYVVYIDALTLTPADLHVEAITAAGAPLNIVEDGDSAVFTAELNGGAPGATELTYTVRDYWSATVATGTVPVASGADAATIDAGVLPIGHYSVSAQVTGSAELTTSASVVLAGDDRVEPADSPFAMDVGGSWHVPEERWDAFARALDLSGVSWIRERLSWIRVNPEEDVFDFSDDPTTEGWLDALDGTGIKILEDISTVPAWTQTPGEKLPSDLNAMYDYAKAAAAHFAGRGVEAWEVMNEVNAGGWTADSETADQYAAVLKAAAIGYEDSGADPLVSATGLAGREPNPWVDLMLRNEVLDYADIYNYHLHQLHDPAVDPTPLPIGVPSYLGLMEPYDPGDTLGWLTEAGLKFPSAANRPMNAEEQRAQARYQVTWAITSISQGTDKHFVFLGPPYDEGTGPFGLFAEATWAPYAGYTAEAAMTAALGEGRYVGTVPGLPAGVTGHVFGDGDDSVLVLWAQDDTPVTLDLDQPTATLTNVVGASSVAPRSTGGFSLDIGPDPVYLRVDGNVPVDTTGAPEPTPTPTETTFDTAQRVVLVQDYPAGVSSNAREAGYALPIDAPTTATVDLYNFNDTAVSGTVAGTTQDGWSVSSAQTVTIPSGGKATLQFQITATDEVAMNKLSPVSFRGTFGGDPTSVSTTLITTDQDVLTVRHTSTGGGDGLRVAVRNPTTDDLGIVATRWTTGRHRGVQPDSVTVPPGETREIEVDLPELDPGSQDYELQVRMRGGGVLNYHGSIAVIDPAEVTDAADHTLTVDGDPDDLTGMPSVDVIEDGRVQVADYGGPADLSGTFALTWDDENLYLTAQLTDDVFAQPYADDDTWQGDSIQFSLAPGWPTESRTWDEYDLAGTGSGAQLYRRRGTGVPTGVVTGVDVSVTRDDAAHTTLYELALPWAQIPSIHPSDGLLSVDLLVNDNDGSGRRGYVEWGRGIATVKDASLFKPVRLLPKD